MATRADTLRRYEILLAAASVIIDSDYGDDLQLPAVARRVFCSERTLERAYSVLGGMTFRAHLCHVRMERAAMLITEGNLRVGDVARRVGYRQAAQFSRAFRQHHGVLPTQYATRVRASGVSDGKASAQVDGR